MPRCKELEELEKGEPIYTQECIFIINPDLEKTILDTIVNSYRKLCRKFQGHVHTEVWGERKLTYPISGHKSGYYVQMYFDATASQVDKLSKTFSADDTILRYLVVKHDTELKYADDPEKEFEYTEADVEAKALSEQNLHKKPVDVFDLIFGIKEG